MGLKEVVGDAVKEAGQWLTRYLPRPSKTAASQHRYPPMVEGIPALSVAEILAQHEDLLAQTKHLVEEVGAWEQWYIPIIERFADFVHLLPASEAHHHRGVGGLLAHSLEVGLYVMEAAYSKLYGLKLEPKDRRQARYRWLLASYVGGLCHDLGKPLALMRVTSPDGKVWEPYSSNILAWCRMQRYFVSFKKRRQGDHEQLASIALDRVLTLADREYLSAYDQDMMLDVLLTVQDNNKAGHEMHAMMKQADNRSVQDDLARSNLAQDLGPRVGLPTMKILLTTMRRLIAEGEWEINKPGGPLWYLADSLFMVWPKGGQDIVAMLNQDKAYEGVPKDLITMLSVMVEWRFIEMTPESSFWLLHLEQLGTDGKPLQAIKVREEQTLVDVLPAPAAGKVEAEKPEPGKENQIVGLAERAAESGESEQEGSKTTPNQLTEKAAEPLVVEPPAPKIVVAIPEERLACLREQLEKILSGAVESK